MKLKEIKNNCTHPHHFTVYLKSRITLNKGLKNDT